MVELLHTTWGLLLWPRLAVYQPIWWRERVMARKQRVVGQEEPTVTWCAILLAHLELLNVETHLHQGRLQLSICSHSILPGREMDIFASIVIREGPDVGCGIICTIPSPSPDHFWNRLENSNQ